MRWNKSKADGSALDKHDTHRRICMKITWYMCFCFLFFSFNCRNDATRPTKIIILYYLTLCVCVVLFIEAGGVVIGSVNKGRRRVFVIETRFFGTLFARLRERQEMRGRG